MNLFTQIWDNIKTNLDHTQNLLGYVIFSFLIMLTCFVKIYSTHRQVNKKSMNFLYFQWDLIIRTQRYNNHKAAVAFWWTSVLYFISTIITICFFRIDDATDVISSPGFLSAFIGIFLSIFTYLIADLLNSVHGNYITGFERFLKELTEELRKFEHLDNIRTKSKQQDIFVIDYHPFIGVVSAKKEIFEEYKIELQKIASMPSVMLHVICNDDETINLFHKQFDKSIEFDKVPKDIDMLELKYGNQNSQEMHPNVTIWRTNKIGPLHFIILNDVAFQYSVVKVGKKNELKAQRIVDGNTISFLRQTYDDYEKLALTPDVEMKEAEQEIKLWFSNQDNIKSAKIHYSIDKSKTVSFENGNCITLKFEYDTTNGKVNFKCSKNLNVDINLTLTNFITVSLVKYNDSHSQTSRKIILADHFIAIGYRFDDTTKKWLKN